MFRKFLSQVLVGTLLIASTAPTVSHAQNLNQALPTDKKVTMGKLANGVTYYIHPNAKPENKVELRLLVNAGSILEDEKQLGLAHFMEHMNFNGTKNFPKNELVNFLQSIGVEFGADLNAYTSFDETVYILPIPTDKPGNLEKGFQIIEDWAHNANLTNEDIDEERGIVLEESRNGKGANDRMSKKYLPKLLADSRYGERLPIGKDDIIKNFKYDEVRRFYKDWYRPDMMAVVVVGDIDVAEAKKMIEKHFAHIQGPKNPKARTYSDLKPYTKQEIMIVTDHEATNRIFLLNFNSRKETPVKTVGDFKEELELSLLTDIVNSRFQHITQADNPPFNAAFLSTIDYARNYKSLVLYTVLNDKEEEGVKSATQEIARLQQHGLNQSELELAKKSILSQYEKYYNERNTANSGSIVNRYNNNFLKGEPIPGEEYEYELVKQLLPTITKEDMDQEFKKWFNDSDVKNHFGIIYGRELKAEEKPLTEATLASTITKGLTTNVQALEDKVVADHLLDQQPVAGTVVSETYSKELDATTYTLSNGVKVTIKETDFKSDEITFNAYKQGGLSNYSGNDARNMNMMSSMIEAMGYGQFKPTELTDALAGKNIGVVPAVSELNVSVNGTSNIKDFETLLELNYLQLTQPRVDSVLFKSEVSKLKTQLRFIKANPQAAFIDTLMKTYYDNNPNMPMIFPNEEILNALDMNRIIELYNKEFGNSDGFHYFIVGNVDKSLAKPLIEKYIASLPTKGTTPKFVDNGLRSIKGNKKFEFRKGTEQKSLIFAMFDGEGKYTYKDALAISLLGDILTIKFLEEMREKVGAIYGGGAQGNFERDPYPHYSVSYQIPCGPENVEKLIHIAEEEVAKIKKEGPVSSDLDKATLAIIEKRKEQIKTNPYWNSKLKQYLFDGYDVNEFVNWEKIIKSITVKDIQNAANKVFDGKESFYGILYPETIKAKETE